LPLIAFEPGPADAAGWIRQLIVSGRFAPGQRLPPERELATQFRVSRSSVREAIREHIELVQAILGGDGARAEDSMRRHVTGFELEIRKALVER